MMITIYFINSRNKIRRARYLGEGMHDRVQIYLQIIKLTNRNDSLEKSKIEIRVENGEWVYLNTECLQIQKKGGRR